MQHRPAGGATYRDSLIAIRDGTLVIGRYYFSTGAKHIRLAAITGVQEYAMTKATGRWRTWGSGDLIHWFNLDPGRRHKQRAFIIDLGRRAKPVITPTTPTRSAPPWWRPGSESSTGRRMTPTGHEHVASPAGVGQPGRAAGARRMHLGDHFDSSRDQDPDGVSSCGDLFVMNADGSHLTRLTNGPASDCGPSFTPDGRHILFFSDRAHPGGDSDLYVMDPDGSAATRLTHANSEEQEPAFTPCKGACP
jgi:hypothetical protein